MAAKPTFELKDIHIDRIVTATINENLNLVSSLEDTILSIIMLSFVSGSDQLSIAEIRKYIPRNGYHSIRRYASRMVSFGLLEVEILPMGNRYGPSQAFLKGFVHAKRNYYNTKAADDTLANDNKAVSAEYRLYGKKIEKNDLVEAYWDLRSILSFFHRFSSELGHCWADIDIYGVRHNQADIIELLKKIEKFDIIDKDDPRHKEFIIKTVPLEG